MNIIKRSDLDKICLPGRIIQKAVGKDGSSTSGKITMGFARYSEESGPMEPHHHAEEVVYILSSKKGWVRYGQELGRLENLIPLETGMVLHNPPLEWHQFGYEQGGHVDIIFIYGQVDKIRPEEMSVLKDE
jgi:hypothetical protein